LFFVFFLDDCLLLHRPPTIKVMVFILVDIDYVQIWGNDFTSSEAEGGLIFSTPTKEL